MRLEIAASRSELTRNQMNQIWYELNCLVLLVLFTKNKKKQKTKQFQSRDSIIAFFFFQSYNCLENSCDHFVILLWAKFQYAFDQPYQKCINKYIDYMWYFLLLSQEYHLEKARDSYFSIRKHKCTYMYLCVCTHVYIHTIFFKILFFFI